MKYTPEMEKYRTKNGFYLIKQNYYVLKSACKVCGKKYLAHKRQLKMGKGDFCSYFCNGTNRRLKDGQAAFNKLYNVYKRGAKKRKLIFSLTKKQFKKLTSSNCYYCGTLPKQKNKHKDYSRPYTYNGLDRLNNNKGYTLKNCVPSCSFCNVMKGTQTLENFIIAIKKIVEHSFKNEIFF